jgi:hypothetical protein
MKALSYTSRVLTASLIVALFSSCGSSGVTGTPAQAQPQGDSTFDLPADLDPNPDYAAYPFSFTTYGFKPTTASAVLKTDTKFIVKINAEASGVISIPGGESSNFSAEYHCAQFKVTLQSKVGGVWKDLGSKVTNNLNVAGTSGCDGGVASQTIDFSAYMSPGHGDMRIQVTSLKTDFYCILYKKCMADWQTYYSYACYWARQPNASLYACPLKTIYESHNVNGSVEVQVNGTTFVN